MPKIVEEKEGTVPKMQVVADLGNLKEASEQCLLDAEAIDTTATEAGREPTEEEYTQIDALLAESEELRLQYESRLKEDRRSAIRASIDIGRERVASAPDAQQMFATPNMRRVSRMHSPFLDDPKRQFNTLGEFASAVYHSAMPNGFVDERIGKMMAAATGMSQGVGSDGGIMVPPAFSQAIWLDMQSPIDNLLPLTDQFTVTGESLTMPASAETSRANGSRYGGVRGFWIAEAAQITASAPKLRQMKLEPQELAALIYVTDKLLRNAPALNTFLTRAASEEILFVVNDALINGDGVGKPLGVLNGGGTVSVAKEVGQAAATIVLENIQKMYSRLHARARAGAVWLINQDVEPELENLTAVAGTGGFPVYLPQGSAGPTITESPNARLKGRPVIPIEYCPTLGTVGDIILVNLGFYATGIQGALRSDVSIHLRFDYAETAFRFMFAIDGQPWLNTAITPFKGSNTKSAYVSLATRA